jgi:hypothetical protein
MATKAPLSWVKYEPRRMMMRCLGLSPLAELAHRRLCDYYWSTRRWAPSDALALAEIIRCAPSNAQALLKELISGGWHEQEGAFAHPDAREILDEATTFQSRAAARGRKGAKARWHETPDSTGANEVPPGGAPSLCSSICPSIPQALPKDSHNSTVHNSTVQRGKGERLTFSVLPREGSAPDESAFFEYLEATLKPTGARKTALEMDNWGGWWRNRFRENPDKARRVINDVASMVKEGRVIKSFGAAAVDLWKRLPD